MGREILGEGSISLKTDLETKGKTVEQAKEYTIYYNIKNCCISLSCLPSDLQTGSSTFSMPANLSPWKGFPFTPPQCKNHLSLTSVVFGFNEKKFYDRLLPYTNEYF